MTVGCDGPVTRRGGGRSSPSSLRVVGAFLAMGLVFSVYCIFVPDSRVPLGIVGGATLPLAGLIGAVALMQHRRCRREGQPRKCPKMRLRHADHSGWGGLSGVRDTGVSCEARSERAVAGDGACASGVDLAAAGAGDSGDGGAVGAEGRVGVGARRTVLSWGQPLGDVRIEDLSGDSGWPIAVRWRVGKYADLRLNR